MIYMKYLYSILFFCCFVTAISAQAPKREMRATWLATVWSLDWPKDFSTTPATTMLTSNLPPDGKAEGYP